MRPPYSETRGSIVRLCYSRARNVYASSHSIRCEKLDAIFQLGFLSNRYRGEYQLTVNRLPSTSSADPCIAEPHP